MHDRFTSDEPRVHDRYSPEAPFYEPLSDEEPPIRVAPTQEPDSPAVLPERIAGASQRRSHPRRDRAPRATSSRSRADLGRFPVLALVSALGLVISALADGLGRQDVSIAYPLFWVGLCVVAVPLIVRLVLAGASGAERLALATTLGFNLYLVKYLQYPTAFSNYDELLHWPTAQTISTTHHLFHPNTLFPVSATFPGLEIITTALSAVAGMPIFAAAMIVTGAARILLVLSLFFLAQRLTHSQRVAGIVVAVYASNPHFLLFDASFSYESLALPLAAFAVSLALLRDKLSRPLRLRLTLIAIIALGALTITHHVTSYLMVAFFAVWTAIDLFLRLRAKSQRRRVSPAPLFAWAGVFAGAWLLLAAPIVLPYLATTLLNSTRSVLTLLSGGPALSRPLFTDYAGAAQPLWEQLSALAATLVLVLAIPAGLLVIWQQFRRQSLMVAFALSAATFPFSLAAHFTPIAGEFAVRATAFLFVPIGVLLGILIIDGSLRWRTPTYTLGLALLMVLLFVGNVNSGAGPDWLRLPGPYLVSASSRSIDPESVGAAMWTNDVLGTGHRMVADRMNEALMADYGDQRIVARQIDNQLEMSQIYFAPSLGAGEQTLLQQGGVQYLVVDLRLASGLPREGVYFDPTESDAYEHKTPIPLAALQKFDAIASVDRIFDSGNIIMYDVSPLAHG